MSEGMDDILNGDDEPEVVTEAEEVTEQPEAQAAEETPAREDGRDEKGRFAPKGEKTDASPASKDEPGLDHPALLGERRRRQEAEDRLRYMEQQLQQMNKAPEPQQIDDDLMYSNPAQYRQLLIEQAKREAVAEAQGYAQQTALTMRVDTSEMIARRNHADFDDKLAKFQDMARSQPHLVQQMAHQPDPAEWAYQQVASQELYDQVREVGSLDALKAKLLEEAKAEQPNAPTIPRTLADAPASGSAPGRAPTPALSLEDILSGKN